MSEQIIGHHKPGRLAMLVLISGFALAGFLGTEAQAKCFWVDEYDIYGNQHSKQVCSTAFDRPVPWEPKIETGRIPFISSNPFTRGFNAERDRQNRQRAADTLDQIRQLQLELLRRELQR